MGGGISVEDKGGGTKKEGLTRVVRRLTPTSDTSIGGGVMGPNGTDEAGRGGDGAGIGVRVGEETDNERVGEGCVTVDVRKGADDVRFGGLVKCKGPAKKCS